MYRTVHQLKFLATDLLFEAVDKVINFQPLLVHHKSLSNINLISFEFLEA